AVGGLLAVVADDDVLAEASPHVAVAKHHEGAVGSPRSRPGKEHECGREGVERLGGQRLGCLAVHPQLEPGEKARVPEEESLGRARRQVARAPGDAERRAFHEGDGAARAQVGHLAGVGPRFGHKEWAGLYGLTPRSQEIFTTAVVLIEFRPWLCLPLPLCLSSRSRTCTSPWRARRSSRASTSSCSRARCTP